MVNLASGIRFWKFPISQEIKHKIYGMFDELAKSAKYCNVLTSNTRNYAYFFPTVSFPRHNFFTKYEKNQKHLYYIFFSFFENVDRIANPSYRPTEQDVLLTRIKTTGIVEVEFEIKKVHFRFV